MSSRVRPARLAAMYVAWGDVLVTTPSEGGRVIGTVIDTRRTPDCTRIFRVRTPRGEAIETKPVLEEQDVWVHVPGGTA
jgi:hypothetical protein